MVEYWWLSSVGMTFNRFRIIAQHDLCHNLHGQVDARVFADGCTAEQRKIYGCAPDADEIERLRAENVELRYALQMDRMK